MLRFLLSIPLLLAACEKDETVSGFVDPEQTFQLAEIDGEVFSARATIQFSGPGNVSGKGPCNSYSGEQTAPYPWLEFGPLRVTRRDCEERDAERQFFVTLASMTRVEALGGTLILRNDHQEMVFTAVQP